MTGEAVEHPGSGDADRRRAASASRRSARRYGAIMNAIADAVGDEIFRRSPVSADIILNALENGGKRTHEPLTAHI